MRNVLLTNDDGIEADGLQALRRALVALDDVRLVVIAPDGNRSAMARSITTRRPLWVTEVEFGDGSVGYATDGTPVDCVRLANLGLVEGFQADLVVSGINHGANLGDDITYSGTVAAALEGLDPGDPGESPSRSSRAPASSTSARAEPTTSRSPRRSSRGWSESLVQSPLPPATLLNINVPGRAPEGVEVTHLGKRVYRDELRLAQRGGGRPALLDLRHRARLRGRARAPTSHAVARGRIALTPLHFDLTDRPGIAALERLDLGRLLGDVSAAPDPAARAAELRAAARLPRAAATTSRTTPRSATTNTTRSTASWSRSRPPIPSSSRPTRRPSASAASRSAGSRRCVHLQPMLSLANVRSEEELRAWVARMRGHLAREGIEDPAFRFVCEPKIDGLAVSLLYRDGVFERGATRGNGEIGEDVTHNLRTIAQIPQRIDDAPRAARGARRDLHVAAGLPGAQRALRRRRASRRS